MMAPKGMTKVDSMEIERKDFLTKMNRCRTAADYDALEDTIADFNARWKTAGGSAGLCLTTGSHRRML